MEVPSMPMRSYKGDILVTLCTLELSTNCIFHKLVDCSVVRVVPIPRKFIMALMYLSTRYRF